MKIVIAVVVALVIGFLLGGVTPRHESASAQKEIKTLKNQLAKAKKRNRLDGFTAKILANELKYSNTLSNSRQNATQTTNGAVVFSNEFLNIMMDSRGSNSTTQANTQTNRPDLRKMIQKASDLWKIGYDIRRQQIISKARLDEDKTAAFDTMVGNLNERLAERVDSWVGYIKQNEFMNEEMGIRMLNDVSSVIVEGYNELEQTMPEEWLADVETREKFEIIDFVNPEIFIPIANLADLVKP